MTLIKECMTPLEEATELRIALSEALNKLITAQRKAYREGEVTFRFDTVINLLILIHADAIRMCHKWEEWEE